MYDVEHEIICKRFNWKKGKILLALVEIVENQTPKLWKVIYCPNHWIIIKNKQQKVYFAQLFLVCWNSRELNLKLKFIF
jgi:hypothetical protein